MQSSKSSSGKPIECQYAISTRVRMVGGISSSKFWYTSFFGKHGGQLGWCRTSSACASSAFCAVSIFLSARRCSSATWRSRSATARSRSSSSASRRWYSSTSIAASPPVVAACGAAGRGGRLGAAGRGGAGGDGCALGGRGGT